MSSSYTKRVDEALATVVTQGLWGENSQKVASLALDEILRLEALLSLYRDDSEVALLNKHAGEGLVELSQETCSILKKAKEVAEKTGGVFDITIGPLVRLWRISGEKGQLPQASSIKEMLSLVDYEGLAVGSDERASLKKGQIIDLGAIGKGYIADMVKRIYQKSGISSAFVNLGGNVQLVGSRPDGSPWRVGIRNPQNGNANLGTLFLRDRAVVTAGDYERYFEEKKVRYHHILDPRTGYPSLSPFSSVTIVSTSSLLADALSTAIFLLGEREGFSLIQEYGVEALLVDRKNKIQITSGLKGLWREEGLFDLREGSSLMQEKRTVDRR